MVQPQGCLSRALPASKSSPAKTRDHQNCQMRRGACEKGWYLVGARQMLLTITMAPIGGGLLLARCFASIYVSFSLDSDDSWTGTSLPRRRAAFVLVWGRQVCLAALEENPSWFLFGHVLGTLRHTVTQRPPSPSPGRQLPQVSSRNKSGPRRMWQAPVSVFLGGPWRAQGPGDRGLSFASLSSDTCFA